MGFQNHLQICSISIAAIDDIILKEVIGDNVVNYKGTFMTYKTSNVEFSETKSDAGGYVTQELKAVITKNGADEQIEYRSWINKKCVMLINYSDGSSKMIGSTHNPVRIQLTQSNSPLTSTLQFKKNSDDYAKFAKSFE